MAARHAVLFVREIDLHQVVPEGDSEFVISSLKTGTNLGSMYGHLIRDVLSFVNSFQSFSFSHSYRQGNAAADAIAKRTRLSFLLLVWMESVPSNVQFVLAKVFLLKYIYIYINIYIYIYVSRHAHGKEIFKYMYKYKNSS